MGRRGRCCCGPPKEPTPLRITSCGSPVAGAAVTVYRAGGFAVASGTTTGASPYWLSPVPDLATEDYEVLWSKAGCEAQTPKLVSVTAGAAVVVNGACNARKPLIAVGNGCLISSFMRYSYSDCVLDSLDMFNRPIVKVTGPSPQVTVYDLNGKMNPVVLDIDPDPCSAVATYTGALTPKAGWKCESCYVDDHVARATTEVSAGWGSGTYAGSIGGGSLFIPVTLDNAFLGWGADIDCGGGIKRREPVIGSGTIQIGISWNLCPVTPTCSMTILHLDPSPVWHPGCPPVDADRLTANLRLPGFGSGSGLKTFSASSYNVVSKSSPASIEFTFDAIPDVYGVKLLSAASGPTASPLGGTVTISEGA